MDHISRSGFRWQDVGPHQPIRVPMAGCSSNQIWEFNLLKELQEGTTNFLWSFVVREVDDCLVQENSHPCTLLGRKLLILFTTHICLCLFYSYTYIIQNLIQFNLQYANKIPPKYNTLHSIVFLNKRPIACEMILLVLSEYICIKLIQDYILLFS